MPVKFNFLEDGRGVEFISTGVVTGDEVIAANKQIYTDEILVKLRYKIIDRTGCTDYRVYSEALRVIADQDREAAKVNANFVILIVSPTPVQYGFTRMWQSYIEGTGLRVEQFNDRQSAGKWLDENLPGPDEDAP